MTHAWGLPSAKRLEHNSAANVEDRNGTTERTERMGYMLWERKGLYTPLSGSPGFLSTGMSTLAKSVDLLSTVETLPVGLFSVQILPVLSVLW